MYWPSSGDHQLHFDFVRDNDAQDFLIGSFSQPAPGAEKLSQNVKFQNSAEDGWNVSLMWDSQGAGRQVCVFMFEFSVQSETTLLSVVG